MALTINARQHLIDATGNLAVGNEISEAINSGINGDLTGPITSLAGVTSVASQTGTGSKFVMDTGPTLESPTLVTPILGAASATTLSLAGGSVGVVSLFLSTDTSTGFYRPAVNQLNIGVSGTKVANFGTSGLNVTGTLGASAITTFSPTTAFESATNSGSNTITSSSYVTSATSAARFIGQHARGSYTTPSALASGDVIATFGAQGYGTSQFSASAIAAVKALATQTFTNTSNGAKLAFYTTPNDSVTAALCLTLDQDKKAVFVDTASATQLISTIATGTAPLVVSSTTQVANLNSATSGTATNLAGGLGGSVPYQSAVNTTVLLANGTAGQVLTSAGTTLAPTWATPVVGVTSDANNNTSAGSGISTASNGFAAGNTAMGYNAFHSNTAGTGNVVMGGFAYYESTGGNFNTVIGYAAAGPGATLGDNNVAVGSGSLASITGGSQNVSIGLNSLLSNTTGSSNTGLGSQANVASGALDHATVVGAQASVSTSNTVVLGRTTDVTVIGATGDDASGNLLQVAGNISATAIGSGLRVKEGSNAKMGIATLVAGTVSVSNTSVTANSRIFLTAQNSSGTPGFLGISARTASTSFDITSSNGADTSTVAWMIVEPS